MSAINIPSCKSRTWPCQMTILQGLLSIASGSLVDFTLRLVGGGRSILAVRCSSMWSAYPHACAIGASAVSVTVSPPANLAGHARAKTVK